jgi:hypothetical protein
MRHIFPMAKSEILGQGPRSQSWSRQTSPLGKYVSLNLNSDSKAKIHSVEAGSSNEVPRDVFQRVLDGAYLALNIQHGTIDAFYFVKGDIYSASKDIKTLRRLGPSVNLTSHDSQTNEGLVMMDVKVHLDNTLVSIRYGATLQSERSRILRHAAKVTTRRAWQRQKELLLTKRFQEAQSWTAYEKNQLSRQGNNPSLALPNYQVEFVRNLDEFPELAADLSNVIFVQSNQKKRNLV